LAGLVKWPICMIFPLFSAGLEPVEATTARPATKSVPENRFISLLLYVLRRRDRGARRRCRRLVRGREDGSTNGPVPWDGTGSSIKSEDDSRQRRGYGSSR